MHVHLLKREEWGEEKEEEEEDEKKEDHETPPHPPMAKYRRLRLDIDKVMYVPGKTDLCMPWPHRLQGMAS